MVPRAPAALAQTVLRLLSSLGTPEAAAALHVGLTSPHLEVRVSTLALLSANAPSEIPPDAGREAGDPADGEAAQGGVPAAGERAREEIHRLLEDPEPTARLDALRTIARLGVVAAGPALVRHIQSPGFHERSPEERREWLETVLRLNAARAERLAIELLEKRQLIPSDALEKTREIAATVLAGFAASQEALTAVKDATKPRWGSSPAVRDAAARAVPAIAARLARRRSAEPAAEAGPRSRSALGGFAGGPTGTIPAPPPNVGRASTLPPAPLAAEATPTGARKP
jgi:hypothetical protein